VGVVLGAGYRGAQAINTAHTCTVVAHAVVRSSKALRFVDATLHDYNMDLAQVAAVVKEHTRAIVATHLFGCPLDVNALRQIVRVAKKRPERRIWVIQAAHTPSVPTGADG
jgi:dTDP-4-amino-4,6-dideoxygalactose transaminase